MSETIRMNISLTDEQRQQLRLAAAKRQMSMSELIRRALILEGIIRPTSAEEDQDE